MLDRVGGLSTAVPFGAGVSFAESARGTDPFSPFETFVHKLIVLMSTGGTLTSLAESGAGTLAGNAQMQVWEQIVKRDGVAIGAAIDRSVCRPLLRGIRDFAGRPPLVKFELGGDRQLSPGEVFDVAAKARAAGYRIAKDELERATGYTLEEAPSAGPQGVPGGAFGLPNERPDTQKPRIAVANPLQNARKGSDGEMPPPAGETRQNAREAISRLAEALGADMAPARDALLSLLDLPEAEHPAAARELLGRLDELMPSDPAMAAVLAEEMAAAFAEGAGEEAISNPESAAPPPANVDRGGPPAADKAGGTEGEAAIANEEGECRAKDPATCPVHGTPKSRRGWDEEQVASGKSKLGSLIEDLGKRGPDGKSKAWKNRDEELGALNAQVAADIKKANPNMKADAGTMQTVDVDQLNHAMLEHGVGREKWPTSVGITHDDLKRIPEVLSDYDEIVPGRSKAEGKKQEAVIFKKRYPDGTVCCVEIDSFVRADNRRILKFQTMWKEKTDDTGSLTRILPSRSRPDSSRPKRWKCHPVPTLWRQPQTHFEVKREMNTLPDKVAAGEQTEVQLAPWGVYPQYDPDKKAVVNQIVDEEAGRRLLENFAGEALVDADHGSENGGSTEALAWITALREDPDGGLFATMKWTDKGAEAVSGRRYRYVSAAWHVGEDGRPDRLASVALTNRPNIPARPILNLKKAVGRAR